jgi:hypothetical protein
MKPLFIILLFPFLVKGQNAILTAKTFTFDKTVNDNSKKN